MITIDKKIDVLCFNIIPKATRLPPFYCFNCDNEGRRIDIDDSMKYQVEGIDVKKDDKIIIDRCKRCAETSETKLKT